MNKYEAYKYHKDELAKHGWHVVNMLHIDDIKDRLNASSDIEEIPSDAVLNDALSYVTDAHTFDDYPECIDYAVDLINEWKTKGEI